MKYSVTLRNFSKEYLPFKFKGFWEEGKCFLRIVSKDGKAIFLCCQLHDYEGTSITNAVENIRLKAVEQLRLAKTENGERVLEVTVKPNFVQRFQLLLTRNAEQESMQEVFSYLRKNSTWIEHYPPSLGLAENGSYAIVKFAENGEPTWNYVSREYLTKKFPEFELNVSIEAPQKLT